MLVQTPPIASHADTLGGACGTITILKKSLMERWVPFESHWLNLILLKSHALQFGSVTRPSCFLREDDFYSPRKEEGTCCFYRLARASIPVAGTELQSHNSHGVGTGTASLNMIEAASEEMQRWGDSGKARLSIEQTARTQETSGVEKFRVGTKLSSVQSPIQFSCKCYQLEFLLASHGIRTWLPYRKSSCWICR